MDAEDAKKIADDFNNGLVAAALSMIFTAVQNAAKDGKYTISCGVSSTVIKRVEDNLQSKGYEVTHAHPLPGRGDVTVTVKWDKSS